jgi:tyrosinase
MAALVPGAAAEKVVSGLATSALPKQLELVGASTVSLPLQRSATHAAVRLDPGVRRKVDLSLTKASETGLPDSVYLKLENVRGNFDASVLGVYIDLPESATPQESRSYLVGDIALFGLRRASVKDGEHGGGGLSFVLDITRIIDRLHLDRAFDVDSLRVSIPVPPPAAN